MRRRLPSAYALRSLPSAACESGRVASSMIARRWLRRCCTNLGRRCAWRRIYRSDLDSMGDMIDSTLAFVRDDVQRGRTCWSISEPWSKVSAKMQAMPAAPSISRRSGIDIPVRPNAISRAVANLVDNAVKDGGTARAALHREPGRVIVVILNASLSLLMTMAPGFPGTSTRTCSHRVIGWSAHAIATPAALASGLSLHARLRVSMATMSSFTNRQRRTTRFWNYRFRSTIIQKDRVWELRNRNGRVNCNVGSQAIQLWIVDLSKAADTCLSVDGPVETRLIVNPTMRSSLQ
jgi:hypothetical protein